MEVSSPDFVMYRVKTLFEASGLTLDELGTKMGYEGDMARKSAWQFLNKTADPRFSMVCRFATAIGVPLTEVVTEPKSKTKK
jgi:transcriptional regulator with XRE-family HTH domain